MAMLRAAIAGFPIAPITAKAQECRKGRLGMLRLVGSIVLVAAVSAFAFGELQAGEFMRPVAAAGGAILFLYGYCEGQAARKS